MIAKWPILKTKLTVPFFYNAHDYVTVIIFSYQEDIQDEKDAASHIT